jgi:hypothetical protein
MERDAARKSMLCFANYLAEWADWFDQLGYFEVADGITHVAMQLTSESGQLDQGRDVAESNQRTSSTIR